MPGRCDDGVAPPALIRRLERVWSVDLGGVAIEWSSRMSRSLGRCYPARGLIRLNADLRGQPRWLEETLIHELAHVATHRLGLRETAHGPGWRRLMRQAGLPDRASVRADDLPRRARPPRVQLTCTDCGRIYLRRRSDRRWRCAVCFDGGLAGCLKVARLRR